MFVSFALNTILHWNSNSIDKFRSMKYLRSSALFYTNLFDRRHEFNSILLSFDHHNVLRRTTLVAFLASASLHRWLHRMSLMSCLCLVAAVAVPLYCNLNLMAVRGAVHHTLVDRLDVVVASYVGCIVRTMQPVDWSLLFQWMLLKLCAASVFEIDFVALQLLNRMTLVVVLVELAKCRHRPPQAIDTSNHALAMSYLG